MRMIPACLAIAALAVGCNSENVIYEQTGSVDVVDQAGVAVVDDMTAQVGMNGTTCEVAITEGDFGTDYDYPGNNDQVVDIGEDPHSGDVVVVVTSDKGVHVQDKGDWIFTESSDYEVPGAADAILTDDGVVVLQDDSTNCGVTFTHTDVPKVASLNDDYCDGPTDLAADPTTGTAYVGTDEGVVAIDPVAETVEEIDGAPAEIIAWDAIADVLYTAASRDTTVFALEGDGSLRWSSDVPGEILDIDAYGDRGQAIVSVQTEDGGGLLVMLDGFTGLEVDRKPIGRAADSVIASADGDSLVTTSGDHIDFYRAIRLW